MEWTDEAIVLGQRAHGETHTIARLFTKNHGAVAGLVHGGQGKTKGALMQPGNGVQASWRARTEDQLGHFTLELTEPRAATAMVERSSLLGLSAVTDLLYTALPEGHAYPQLYMATCALLDHLDVGALWPILLVKWEVGLLEQLGYGLTLDHCVATGRRQEDGAALVFVSPKSGGAVCYEAGLPYKDKMLPLPPFLIDQGEPVVGDVKAAFRLTAHFLRERLLSPVGAELPDARDRLISRLRSS